jgi:hypothetical protein
MPPYPVVAFGEGHAGNDGGQAPAPPADEILRCRQHLLLTELKYAEFRRHAADSSQRRCPVRRRNR